LYDVSLLAPVEDCFRDEMKTFFGFFEDPALVRMAEEDVYGTLWFEGPLVDWSGGTNMSGTGWYMCDMMMIFYECSAAANLQRA
jgi:hypothetical protein